MFSGNRPSCSTRRVVFSCHSRACKRHRSVCGMAVGIQTQPAVLAFAVGERERLHGPGRVQLLREPPFVRKPLDRSRRVPA